MSLEGPPEVHAPHDHKPHGGGLGRPPAWLEWFTSIAALIVSISSIVIAVHHGETMDKLVKANSFPYLIVSTSDATPEGRAVLSIDLLNNGVGPADERSLRIKIGDRYVTSVKDLLAAVLGPEEAERAKDELKPLKNTVHTRFIAPHSSGFVFRIDKTAQNARDWDAVAESMGKIWTVEYCYCSVFEECWAVRNEDHTPVKACKRDEPREFMP
jgi:hypothetical protein